MSKDGDQDMLNANKIAQKKEGPDEEEFSQLSKTLDNPRLFKTMNSMAAPLAMKRVCTRYKMLLVFGELVELSEEFLKASKITLVYNFLGLEGKFVLTPANFNQESTKIAINKVRLYYFFAENTSAVGEVLRQKDVFYKKTT